MHIVRGEPSWEHCPLCGLMGQQIRPKWANVDVSPPREEFGVSRRRCGIYSFGTLLTAAGAWGIAAEQRLYLSCGTRQGTDRGSRLRLELDHLDQIERDHKNSSVSLMMDKVLRYLERHSRPGELVPLDLEFDYPLFDATSQEQAVFLANQLIHRGLIDEPKGGFFRLTADGWELIQPLSPSGVPGLCFVAMSFHRNMTAAYELGMVGAIETDCNLRPERIDYEHFQDRICDRLVSDIRRAEFVVADVSHHRRNVYFEAGFAIGLGRPVIWTCCDKYAKVIKLQFDTQEYQHIFWASPEELREKLATKIRALGFARS